jgi:hypothetical protein
VLVWIEIGLEIFPNGRKNDSTTKSYDFQRVLDLYIFTEY